MSSRHAPASDRRAAATRHRGTRRSVLAAIAIVWLFPAPLRALHVAAAVRGDGRVRLRLVGGALNFDNYRDAWTQADLPHYFVNSLIVTVPAVLLTLFLASFVAFSVSRFSGSSTWRC